MLLPGLTGRGGTSKKLPGWLSKMQGAWFERLKETPWEREGVSYHRAVTVPLWGRGDRASHHSQHSQGEGHTRTRLEIEKCCQGEIKGWVQGQMNRPVWSGFGGGPSKRRVGQSQANIYQGHFCKQLGFLPSEAREDIFIHFWLNITLSKRVKVPWATATGRRLIITQLWSTIQSTPLTCGQGRFSANMHFAKLPWLSLKFNRLLKRLLSGFILNREKSPVSLNLIP